MRTAVADVTSEMQSRDVEAVVADLEKLAKRTPTSALPWSRIAKIRFDQEQYGPAIVAADEALQRDPDDFVAKSIRVVGGLRLALQGIMEMKENALLVGNAKTDAVTLAKAMREALGRDLFPPARYASPPPTPAAQPQPAATPQPTTSTPPAGGGNPFEGLF